MSRDHKPDQSDERERIENAGGFVMWAGTWRVGGVLAVSRSFGDRLLKEYVIADPEIQEEKIDDSLEFLILASDGLWDVFSNEEAVAVVKEVEDPEESTKKLVGEAIKKGSADNITCVVVRFLESKTANNTKASHISSTHASSSHEATKGETIVRSDSDHEISAKETNQDHAAEHSELDPNAENVSLNQKPVAVTAEEESSVSSEEKGSAGEKNQVLSAIQSGSEPKSSTKHIIVHNDMDGSVANQKPVVDVQNAIAATHTTSSEQSGSLGEKNQKLTTVHSDSNTSNASNVNSYH